MARNELPNDGDDDGDRRYITELQMSPVSPGVVVVAWSNGNVELWDFIEGEKIGKTYSDHPSLYVNHTLELSTGISTTEERYDAPVDALAISPDGALVATGGRDGRVVIRQVEDGEMMGRPIEVGGSVGDLAFLDEGTRLAVVSGGVQVWRLGETPKQQAHVRNVGVGQLVSAGNRFVTLGTDQLGQWDRSVRNTFYYIPRHMVAGLPEPEDNVQVTMVRSGTFFGENDEFIATFSRDSRLTVWNTLDRQASYVADGKRTEEGDEDGLDMIGLADGVAVLAEDRLEVWNYGKEKLLTLTFAKDVPGHVSRLSLSSDGQKILAVGLSGAFSFDRRSQVWTQLHDRGGPVAALDATGDTVVFDTGEEWRIVDRLGNWRRNIKREEDNDYIALSPSGELAAIVYRNSVDIISVSTGRVLRRIETDGFMWVSGRELKFVGGNRYIAIGAKAYGFDLWEVDSGLFAYHIGTDDVCCSSQMLVDRSGRRLAEIGGYSDGVAIWTIDEAMWRRSACGIVQRELSALEVNRYYPNAGQDRAPCKEGN